MDEYSIDQVTAAVQPPTFGAFFRRPQVASIVCEKDGEDRPDPSVRCRRFPGCREAEAREGAFRVAMSDPTYSDQ